MEQHKDLAEMVQILTTAIAIHEREEIFFRDSANRATAGVSRSLFLNIADDLADYRIKLEERKQRL